MSKLLSPVLVLAGCLAAGCTAIVYGDRDEGRRDDLVSNGSRASSGGAGEQPAPAAPSAGEGGRSPAPGADGGAGVGEAGAAGHEGGGSSAGGAEAAGGAAGQASEGGAASGGEPGAAGGSDDGQGGAAGSPDHGSAGAAGAPLLPGDPARGHKLVVSNNCYQCHGSELSGQGFYPNITPDEATGIGSWTDGEISRAIAGGINPQGELLCASMPIYSGLSRQALLDVVAFLRAIPARVNPITSRCPGHDP